MARIKDSNEKITTTSDVTESTETRGSTEHVSLLQHKTPPSSHKGGITREINLK